MPAIEMYERETNCTWYQGTCDFCGAKGDAEVPSDHWACSTCEHTVVTKVQTLQKEHQVVQEEISRLQASIRHWEKQAGKLVEKAADLCYHYPVAKDALEAQADKMRAVLNFADAVAQRISD